MLKMENQKEMCFGDELCTDFVPHDRIQDVILKIEKMKEDNAKTCLFLPSWADDKYFTQLYTEVGNKSAALGTTIELVASKKADDTNNTGELLLAVPKRSTSEEADINPEDITEYIIGIIQKAKEIVRQESATLTLGAVHKSVVVKKPSMNDSDLRLQNEHAWQMKHESLMNPILEDLKDRTKQIRSRLDKTALKPVTPQKFVPRKLFLSNIETFKLSSEPREQASLKIKREDTKLVKPDLTVQTIKVSPRIQGLSKTKQEDTRSMKPDLPVEALKLSPEPRVQESPTTKPSKNKVEEPCTVAKRRRPTWRKRVLRFLGFLKRE